jgi:hypothetical protein
MSFEIGKLLKLESFICHVFAPKKFFAKVPFPSFSPKLFSIEVATLFHDVSGLANP